jgi:DNA-binding CsgD family transcriptional regulator
VAFLRAGPRQLQVLALIARGHTDLQIGRDLGISVTTVRTYLVRLYRDNGFCNRTEAVAAWVRFGYEAHPDPSYAAIATTGHRRREPVSIQSGAGDQVASVPWTRSMIGRRAGVHIDAARLDYELGRRGISPRQFAELSGVNETTLSRARHGYRVRESTLRRIVAAMLRIPTMPGAELLLSEPQKRAG